MKKIELNPLNQNQRRMLQFGVIVLLGIFLAGYFLLRKSPAPEEQLKNNTVYIEDSVLHVFDDTISIAEYPSRVSVHYPYLLVILSKKQTTKVYNLETKSNEKTFGEALLDYSNGKVLKNTGKTTFLDELDLEILCEKGFIKSDTEVLCLTKVNANTVENKLVSITIPERKQKEIYVSKDIITDFSVLNDKIYIGEINLHNKQNYLIVDATKTEVPSVVTLIYEMGGEPYFATLKGALSEEESYFQVKSGKMNKSEKNRIYLFE
jgi:hypothetical protein